MKIKTIINRLEFASVFDRDVNEAISEGWILKKRHVLPGKNLCETRYVNDVLIAEMVRGEELPLTFKSQLENFAAEIDTEINTEKIRVKYFVPNLEPIQKIAIGDWIDLRAAETVTLNKGEYTRIRLGVGMILPDGYEAHVVPRSSTPEQFGIISANSMNIIDNSYSGDTDEWAFPALAFRDTAIEKGDRICQFRIMKNQPSIVFETVDRLKEVSRGGYGSTGRK